MNALLAALLVSTTLAASEPLLRERDHVCLVGNALAERVQHHGWLETRLQLRGLELTVRNLGFAGDTLTVRQRTSGFGAPDDWLDLCEADVVLAFFGFVESFDGPEGLDAFRGDLAAFVDRTLARIHRGDRARRLVLFSSIPFEDLGDPLLPRAGPRNDAIALYRDATREVAAEKDVPFVDLFESMGAAMAASVPGSDASWTLDGIHLGEDGNRLLAEVVDAALFDGSPLASENLETPLAGRVRERVLEKNRAWFDRYRARDGYNVYGGRSSLAYEGGVTNRDVLQREMFALEVMASNLDREIWTLARGEDPAGDLPVPPLLEVATNRPGDGPDGEHVYAGGEAAIARMTPADGLRVELFASEETFPELVNPVQMSFDPAGRLWVAVWPTYPHEKPGEPADDALLVLEDADGDGRADRCTAFADGLHDPTGFEHWNGGVLVANPPDLLFLEDTDGDGAADVRRRILGALSSADTHHAANSFVLGPEGALYFQEGVFHRSQIETVWGPVRNQDACVWRFDPRTWRVERYAPYDFANPHGHVFDRWGQDFVTDATGNQNYWALPITGHLDEPRKHRGYFPFLAQRSRPAAATEILSSTHFPDEFQENYLVANVIGFQGIHRYAFADDGAGFAATELEPLVQSTDPSFRPVDVEVGPDGAVWFLDWHNALIGHMQHHLRDPSRDREHGRVYRILHAERPLSEPPEIAGRPVPDLLELLAHREDRVRYRARIELSARESDEVVAEAQAWWQSRDDARELLEALWVEAAHGVLDRDLLERVLVAPDPRVRAGATRVLRHMRRDCPGALELLEQRIADPHPRVRAETLVALSWFPGTRSAELALRVLEHPMDRFLDYALEETLAGLEPGWRAALAGREPFAEGNETGLAYALARLPTAELAGARPGAPLHREVLTRHGLAPEAYVEAARGLAAGEPGSTVTAELVAAIERADERAGGHVDHLLSGLFAALDAIASEAGAAPDAIASEAGAAPDEVADDALARFATAGRRTATRRLATAARLERIGDVGAAWDEAAASFTRLGDLLDAAPLVDDAALRDALFPRVLEVLDGLPPALAAGAPGGTSGGAPGGTPGRRVRIDLPGDARTLTLAEVEVFRGDENVASRGAATQSSVNWGGEAGRATDGVTSGRFEDGGQTHTMEDRRDPWWELDLGEEVAIDRIVVWNRTDTAELAARLDGFVLRVLGEDRREVFRAATPRAEAGAMAFDLSAPEVGLRRRAALALGRLGVRGDEAAAALVRRFDDAELAPAVVEALSAIPVERWSDDAARRLGEALLARFGALRADAAPHEPTRPEREMLALARRLAPRLAGSPDGLGARLERAAARLGPLAVVIRPVPDALLFDTRELTVVAGRPIELVFDNVDLMPHNLLVAAPGSLATVGMAAERMAADPDAWDRGYVPDVPEVIVATALLQPGESETLRFRAPEAPGDYPYVCTFPGHWVRMNGVLHVVADESLLEARRGPASEGRVEPAAVARPFVKHWKAADFELDGPALAAASPERGRAVLEAASCLACHSIALDDGGGLTGPLLSEAAARYDAPELLRHLLEPSARIAEEYATEIVVMTDGAVYAGVVVEETAEHLVLRDDPYRVLEPLLLPLDEIAERAPSTVSTMPTGLLSTFERADVVDLVAYLRSLAPGSDD